MSATLDIFQQPAGTLLAAHLPNYGSAWTIPAPRAPRLDGRGAGALLNSAGIWSPNTGGGDPVAIALTPAITGDATAAVAIQRLTDLNTDEQMGVLVRYTSPTSWYGLVYSVPDSAFNLLKATGAGVELPAQAPTGWNPDAGGTLLLEVSGGRLYAILPDGQTIDYTDGAPLAGPGAAGILYSALAPSASATTGIHASQFLSANELLYPLP